MTKENGINKMLYYLLLTNNDIELILSALESYEDEGKILQTTIKQQVKNQEEKDNGQKN